MKKIYFLLILSCLSLGSIAQTTTFNTASTSAYSYTVPSAVTQLAIDMAGGQGGYGASGSSTGGKGGRVQCTVNVTAGTVYYVFVGGAGVNYSGSSTTTGGINGGGTSSTNGTSITEGGSGGGCSSINSSSASFTTGRLIVAAGGGGGGEECGNNEDYGGGGGGTTGGNGYYCNDYCSFYTGTGATQSGGGASDSYYGGAGTSGTGATASYYLGGGGGGGYYGGGGAYLGGGGGGSSYYGGTGVITTTAVTTTGYNSGPGYVQITALCNQPGTITGTPTVCPGATTSLSDPTGTTGGSWSISSSAGNATISSTGVVTGVTTGIATVTYSLSNVCSPGNATFTVTVQPVPAAITGTGAICTGTTLSLSDASAGGTWSSSNVAIGSIGSISGVVTGILSGTPTITYNLPSGCSPVTTQVTINTQPGGITGTTSGIAAMCQGATTSVGDPNTGGTWTSASTGVATINPGTGVITGVSGGTSNITYTLAGGCYSTALASVNPISAISGVTSMCNGFTSTLSDATGGGLWTSSTPTVATIGSSSGILSGVSVGSTTITYAMPTGCKATAGASISNTPNVYSVTGGGIYCSGTGGVHIGVNNSDIGVGYELYLGATAVGVPVVGTGSPLDLGAISGAGTYTVVANPGSSCSTNMSGSATVSVNALPTTYTVTGGGSYCSGTSGTHVGLSGSTPGVTYQLYNGITPVGSPVLGTSFTLDFGLQTSSGTYTVIATNSTTGCYTTMPNSVVVSIGSLPTSFSVTGGGNYCLGGSGVHIGLSSSSIGINYQLSLSGTLVGSVLPGTGTSIDFGFITTAGSYAVIATNPSTTCTNSMSGIATVSINPLPGANTVGGGGSFCLGSTGVNITLSGSTTGINYQLYTGTSAVGTPLAGTGSLLTYGPINTPGSYTVLATNTTTGCQNNMFGSASLTLAALPSVFTVTGGGGYCAGASGIAVGLSGSVSGATYSLYNGITLVGAAGGTGSSVSFGLQTAPGTYTAIGTNPAGSGGCTGNMSGSVVVTINPLPTARNVTGGGSYCAGSTGVAIGLDSAYTGISYRLFNGSTAVGPYVSGTTGSALTFGLETLAGSYSVVATNNTTGCTNNMTGSASIVINPVPTVYAVTGGGNYCTGGTGVHIGLAASNTGIKYTLTNGSSTFASVTGTGSSIDFGLQTAAGTYTVLDTNTTTLCRNNASGNAVITINPLPNAYPVTIVGGGAICAGSSAAITMTPSDAGVNYQLYNGTTPMGLAVAGTGSLINFGAQSAGGTYKVVGTNATNGCTNNMASSPAITIVPLPGILAVTGGGSTCVGGAGVAVGLSSSATGVNYQLMLGGGTVGAAVPGTGAPISFGLQSTAGTYTVVAALSGASACTSNMSGSATVSTLTSSLPGLYTISGGGNYCAGGAGVSIGLSGSASGVTYQLYNGTAAVGAPLSGSTLTLGFGLQTAAGNYTVVATNTATGCNRTMSGIAPVAINALPNPYNVTGGGSYCPSASGVSIGLNGSDAGVSYQLYNGSTPVAAPTGILTGTGTSLSFGSSFTTAGLYTIVATNSATTCSGTMAGSATVGVYTLPSAYNVTGGGNYCTGGTGVNVGLNNSNTGVSYQLYNYAVPVGSAMTGTGSAISFGAQTAGGPYTVTATGIATTCTNNMTGSATVNVNALPAAHTVTGGGNYCAGGTGVAVGLNGSNTSVDYQLYNSSGAVGSPMPGTGSAISFGMQTASGSYSVMATNVATTCMNGMADTVMVNINALPTPYTLTGGGNYCAGGAGVDVALSSTDPGIMYQLFNGTTMVGSAMPGSGSGIDFGNQAAAGTYTVMGSNPGTSCSGNMAGSVVVNVNPLPTVYSVSGGGNYCAGGTGLHILLSGSNAGNTYQLSNGGTAVTTIPGTGGTLDFGAQTAAGNYTVMATHIATGCTNNMFGSANINVLAAPNAYAVTGLGSSYCAGGAGVDITMGGSDAGITYQLYKGTALAGGPVAGSGVSIDFGLNTAAGSYTVVATNPTTGCTATMPGVAAISITPLPPSFVVTGGGSYCNGGTGVHIGLSGSNTSAAYQLYDAAGAVGAPVTGTGFTLDFGSLTNSGHYTVIATGISSGCSSNMSGSATVAVNALPSPFTVTGGGNYCAGGAGIHVGLSGSALDVNYQLYHSGTIAGAPATGSGFSIDFGAETTAGVYQVVATNATTGCADTMAGMATVGVNPLPIAYAVTGGGNYCPGGTGVHVGLGSSDFGVSYQLYNSSLPTTSSAIGTGTGIDFGLQTAAGTYSVIAIDGSTGCTNTMSGSVAVVINTLPTVYSVAGGGNFCAGGAGVIVSLTNSNTGVNYTLYNSSASVITLPGTGGPLDFGHETVAGAYTVLATDATTGCSDYQSGSVMVTVTPAVAPAVTITTGVGDTICAGSLITFSAIETNGGPTPSYQWTVNGAAAGTGSTFSYSPADGDNIGLTFTSSAACATPAFVNSSIMLTVQPHEAPAVVVTAMPGTDICQGSTATFTASPSYGGSAPVYTWSVNAGSVLGVTGPTYSYIPANGDVVAVVMASNYHCRLSATATSANVNMEVDPAALPVVSISASNGNTLVPGETDILTATITNGGPTPSIQWYINGVAVPGATTATLNYNSFNDLDSVTCQVVSSGGCSGKDGFNSIIIHLINNTGVQQIASANSDIKLIPNPNKGAFTIKGTLGIPIAIGTDEEVTIEITNIVGQVIYNNVITAHNGEINETIQLNNTLANGMYLLNLHSASANKVLHLVIEQ